MRRFTAAVIGLVVAALAAASGTGAVAMGPGSPGASATVVLPDGGRATVTLVTGDRVTVEPSAGGQPDVIFEPAPGSESTGFHVARDGTHVRVVPDDVASLVPDVLAPALFDVTALVEMGYDDRRSDELPLIVRRAAGARTLASPLQPARSFSSIGATAVELDKDDAVEFGDNLAAVDRRGPHTAAAALGVTKVWLDRRVEADALDPYLSQVSAPAAWSAGLTGAGVRVAVLDTGVDDAHPALTGQVDAQANFTDAASPADGNGHGTHVASLLAGTGAGSDGARQGIAPGADLLSGKVLGDDRSGQESWVIAGMEWAAAQGADVVNLSLGGQAGETDDPLAQSLDALTAQTRTLFVSPPATAVAWAPARSPSRRPDPRRRR